VSFNPSDIHGRAEDDLYAIRPNHNLKYQKKLVFSIVFAISSFVPELYAVLSVFSRIDDIHCLSMILSVNFLLIRLLLSVF
jgi:hypothetical protein